MTATNHAASGALVACFINQPLVALVAAFGFHFVLDALPHFGINSAIPVAVRNKSRLFQTVLLTDVVLASTLLIAIPLITKNSVNSWLMAGCMVACMSPDLIWGYRYIGELKSMIEKPKNLFSRFHSKVQWSETEKGIIVEIVWLGTVLLIIFNKFS